MSYICPYGVILRQIKVAMEHSLLMLPLLLFIQTVPLVYIFEPQGKSTLTILEYGVISDLTIYIKSC